MLLNRDGLDLYHKWKLSHRLARRTRMEQGIRSEFLELTMGSGNFGGRWFLLAACCFLKWIGVLPHCPLCKFRDVAIYISRLK